MNTPAPCDQAPHTPPTITWRIPADDTGRHIIITLFAGQHVWRLDEPNAKPSRPYPSYLEARLAARTALNLPAIGGCSK